MNNAIRHANVTLPTSQLDDLHALKRRLSRERGERLTMNDIVGEAIAILLRHHEHAGWPSTATSIDVQDLADAVSETIDGHIVQGSGK